MSLSTLVTKRRVVAMLIVSVFSGISASVFAGYCSKATSVTCTEDRDCPMTTYECATTGTPCTSDAQCASGKACTNQGNAGQSCSTHDDCDVKEANPRCSRYTVNSGQPCTDETMHEVCGERNELWQSRYSPDKCIGDWIVTEEGTCSTQAGNCEAVGFDGGQCVTTSVGSNGSCSAFAGSYTTQPASSTTNGCVVGTFKESTDTTTQRKWQCVGINGGTTATCAATKKSTTTKIDGVCKSYPDSYATQPASSTTNGCTAGTFKESTDTATQRKRQCAGENGGSTASCVSTKTIGGTDEYRLEMECADARGANYAVKGDKGNASRDQYVVHTATKEYTTVAPTTTADMIPLHVSVKKAGTYYIHTRVNALSPFSDDDIWVEVNKAGRKKVDVAEIVAGYQWKNIGQYSFVSGTNEIRFAKADNSIRLDKILVSASSTSPTGIGVLGTNCKGNVCKEVLSCSGSDKACTADTQCQGSYEEVCYPASGLCSNDPELYCKSCEKDSDCNNVADGYCSNGAGACTQNFDCNTCMFNQGGMEYVMSYGCKDDASCGTFCAYNDGEVAPGNPEECTTSSDCEKVCYFNGVPSNGGCFDSTQCNAFGKPQGTCAPAPCISRYSCETPSGGAQCVKEIIPGECVIKTPQQCQQVWKGETCKPKEVCTVCGNHICEEGETTQNCPDDCGGTICGNGVKEPGEICDDGANNGKPGKCSVTCDSICGNGTCDAGETATTCPGDCGGAVCGNGVKETGEVCDDGANNGKPGKCSITCDSICGNGTCDAGETATTCPGDCGGAVCGNGKLESGEICDDGNTSNSDGCSNQCKPEDGRECPEPGKPCVEICGDGKKVGDEVCDDGADNGKPGKCSLTCTDFTAGYCQELSMVPTTIPVNTYVPFDVTFTCTGVGSKYELTLYDSKNAIVTKRTDTKSFTYTHTFAASGTYQASCFVDGVAQVSCNNTTSTTYSIASIVDSYIRSINRSIVQKIAHKGIASLRAVEKPLYQEIRITAQTSAVCTNLCQKTVSVTSACGNGILEPGRGEICDDGNTSNSDGCSNQCKPEDGRECPEPGKPCIEICGDGKKVGDEVCDDGADNGKPGKCSLTCDSTIPQWCGNGLLNSGETCDDGNTTNGDGCNNSCQKEGTNNGGGGHGGDGKTSTITCGNGRITGNEECDDDNTRNGDGCSASCRREDDDSDCGNGDVEVGEACDDGNNNGDEKSICLSDCRLKGFRGNNNAVVPACSFVDPPSLQDNEYLPFRRAFEDDGWMISGDDCSEAKHTGQIPKESMTCHFTVLMPDTETYTLQRPCFDDSLATDAKRYADFQQDLKEIYGEYGTIDPKRGKSYVALSELKAEVYGEFAIQLDKVTYDLCVKDGDTFNAVEQDYAERVCQYNFAVTTPYFMQKGASLSSKGDDKQKLSKFRKLDGRTILDVSGIRTLEDVSVQDAFERMKKQAEANIAKAVDFVRADHELGSLGVGIKKIPAQEVYVADSSFTMPTNTTFNAGKPTTIIVTGPSTVRIQGSLQGNVLLLVPDGTVEFINADCDQNDRIKGIIVAKSFTTSSTVYDVIANNSLRKIERCMGGGLTVEGIMIGLQDEQLQTLKQIRRSTLKDRFSSVGTLQTKIFDGAAVRVDAGAASWTNLPPLADVLLESLEIMRDAG